MSDEELRNLERIYHGSGSPQDLLAANVARVRAGLLPIRDRADFLTFWAADLHRLIDSNDDFDPTDITLVNWFSGTCLLSKLNVPVDVWIHTETNDEGQVYSSLEIEFEPLHSGVLSEIRAWLLRATIHEEFVTILIPRKTPSDWTLRRPYEESQIIPNTFLSAEDLLNYLMVIYRQEVVNKWKELLEIPSYMVTTPPGQNAQNFGGPNMIITPQSGIAHLRGVLQAATILKRTKQLLNKPNPLMQFCITTSWFKNSLAEFSQAAERYLEERGMHFDLEQTWPVVVKFSQDHYYLSIETGYNDIVDPEEFDVTYPEGQRGTVDQVASNFAEGLELFMSDLGKDSEWDVNWEYEEEYEPESEDIAIGLKAEIPITSEFLEKLLTRNWTYPGH